MISESALEEFRTRLRGQLVLPKDADYDDARRIHNAMMAKKRRNDGSIMHLRSRHRTLASATAEIARASPVPLPVQRKSRVIVARGRDVRAF